jgi:ketosteroid isomerase-like protein
VTLHALIEELVVAWQANDAHRASAFFAEDGVYHESGGEAISGREAIFKHFRRFFRDGPPWRFEIEEIIVENERAAVAYRFSINRRGRWHESAGCALVRREGGLIAHWREYHG